MDLAAMLNSKVNTVGLTQFPVTTNVLQTVLAYKSTATPLAISPPAIYPNAVAIALKSNQFVYGPWGQFTANGKLEFEQDEGLRPEEYGGYDLLNQAAIAKLATIAKGNQVLERGDWTEAGLPKASLGDILVKDGPILTSVNCDISTNQVVTNYNMETFVNRAGAFIYENQERLKRIGKIYQQLRRTMRELIFQQFNRSSIYEANYKGFMYGTTYAVDQRSNHAVMGGNLILGSGGNYIPQIFSQTYQESLANIGVQQNGNYFQNVACVGLEALFRPYTYDVNNQSLPLFYPPDSGIQTGALISSTGINPLTAGCDISWVLNGQLYNGMNTNNTFFQTDWSTAKSMALKGPLMIQGWGYDIQGKPVPNSTSGAYAPYQSRTTDFLSNWLQKSFYWPTGPLDVAWDKIRGVWAGRGMQYTGVVSGSPIAPRGLGKIVLEINDRASSEIITVQNPFRSGQAIPTGVTVTAIYNPLNNRIVINGADCFSSN
jgi:hypothetical protein